MKMMELFKPAHKKPIVLVLLLSWFLPFMGVISFSMLSAKQVLGETGGNKSITEKRSTPIEKKRDAEEKTNPDSSSTRTQLVQVKPQATPPVSHNTNDKPSAPTAPVTSDPRDNIDINLLAKVIYAEARGEPFEGQVAVGAVLVNRVVSSKFPNSLRNVVFKEGEFCTVRDGQVWLQPDATAYRAAKLAKSGWDPSKGALYFYNPSKTTSRWIWSRMVTTQIGSHLFAR